MLWALFDVILFSRKDFHLLQAACFVVSFSIETTSSFVKQIFKKLIFLLSVRLPVWHKMSPSSEEMY